MNRATQNTNILITTKERKNLLEWLAVELLQEWGLTAKGWKFVWGNTKSAFGMCRYNRRTKVGTIELSLYLLPTINDEEAEDTVRHEIAHALDYDHRGTSDHYWQWQQWAIKVGAKPTRCGKATEKDAALALAYKSKYRLECPNGCVQPSHRIKKAHRSQSCVKCGNGYYNPALKLTQIVNHPDNTPIEYGGNVDTQEKGAA